MRKKPQKKLIDEIEKKYASLGGAKSPLGPPVDDTCPGKLTADGGGVFRDYRAGSIYSFPERGTYEVHGSVWNRWDSLERERGVGYPTSDEQETPDGVGRFSNFERGSIYYYPNIGAFAVCGPILELWRELGAEAGRLGYPKSGEIPLERLGEGGCFSRFQHGCIYWDRKRGAYEVQEPPVRPGPDQEAGSWEKSVYNSRVVGIHAALLRDGSVLFFSHGNPTSVAGGEWPIDVGSAVLDFMAPAVTQQELDPGVICSGHTFLRDGRLIACGSERDARGVHALRRFDPADGECSGKWHHLENLTEARWYPTCVELPDGRVLIVGGQQWSQDEGTPNCTFQVYDPEQGMLPPQPLPLLREEGAMYPFTFVLPSGQTLIHAGRKTCFLDLDTLELDGRVLEAAEREGRNSRTYDLQGTSVLLPLRPDDDYRARVMLLGGGGAPEVTANTPATNTCEILDLGEAEPAWRMAAPMAHPRVMPDAVLLPDGNVLVTNGSSTGKADAGVNPVFETELYDVERDVWTTLCSMQTPRLYHSVALLLPDARVLTAGEDSIWHPGSFTEEKLDIEIFTPPYLYRGQQPIIQEAPKEVGYDAEFKVRWTGLRPIRSAAFISPGSVTHSFNSHQRYVGLSILRRPSNKLTLRAPRDAKVAPPGWYMLFLVDELGIPSHARFVRLG
jgi:Domain of unknown function (DUF1929)/Glyoxal oxidase N-terminus/LGFP repeat